jgi:hypothetical protein
MVATGNCFASMNTTPIAILIYRRPALVRGLLTALRVHQPKKIWIIADGPKEESENELCSAARQEAENGITWKCAATKVYADKNLGLKDRVETGLDELFAHESSAIILEEDCHPSEDFIPFCQEMLDQYQNEAKVGGISGGCFLPKEAKIHTDYFFSRYMHIWGWATWARTWNAYRQSSWTWPPAGYREYYLDCDQDEFLYWERIFGRVKSGEIHSWDYHWISSFWKDGLVSITPAQNLVRNVGFGADATNTQDETAQTGMEREGSLNPPFTGPSEIRADADLDRQTFRNHLLRQEGKLSFWRRIRRSLAKRVGI